MDRTEKLEKLAVIIEHHLNRIRGVYADPEGVRLTLVIRHPETPDGSRNVVATDDDVGAVVEALRLAESEGLNNAGGRS